MKGGHFGLGQVYVAFSRVKKLQGLHIINFDPKAIKTSKEIKNEMQRLNNKLLKPLPPAFNCPSLSDDYITLALLNVRYVVANLPDIEQDDCLKFLRHGSQDRCHHQFYKKTISEDNKGGVMISMPQTMQPFHTSVLRNSN